MLRAGLLSLPLWLPSMAWAADSYRWLRVTIDTPWAIFLFLLPMVLIPVVLMAILYWRYTFRPVDENKGRGRRSKTESADIEQSQQQ